MRLPEELRVYHLITPLSRPYLLPFGTVTQFDSFVALAVFADGDGALGESTPLPGYSHETAAQVAHELRLLARNGDLQAFLRRNAANPFVTAPLLTCLDETNLNDVEGEAPLCPILQWHSAADIAPGVARLAAGGNRVIKVKLSRSLDETREILRHTQPAGVAHGVRFRYDANQTLSPDVAAAVVRLLDDPTTELLEQPLPTDAWDAMADLHAWSPVPLMLDESIVTADDVERAAGCADLVKFKLAKNRSPSCLMALVRRARQLGLDVVLGNGVQGAVGCALEAKVQLAAGLTRPGEMNGYRKVRYDPLGFLIEDHATGLRVRRGWDAGEVRRALERAAAEVFVIPLRGSASSAA